MSDLKTAWALIGQGRGAEAEAAARRAPASPDAQRALGTALQLQHRYDEAAAVLQEALARAQPPLYGIILRDICQLIWMRTGDLAEALKPVDAALAAAPDDPQLRQLRAMVQQYAGELDAAAETLAEGLARTPGDLLLLLTASHIAAERGEGAAALAYATQAAQIAPEIRRVQEVFAVACLAAGHVDQASAAAARMRASAPNDPVAVCLQADAWRMLGDARYRQLYDYEAFVRSYTIAPPAGWTDLPSFLADLTRSLDERHTLEAHPLQQSLRHGSQVQGLLSSDDPVIRAFFAAMGKPIGRYIAEIGQGGDPLRARNTGKARMHSAWSVRLKPNGFHVNHFHPEGWLSSAFYVETPKAAVDAGDRQGWLKFGEPGIRTSPPLPPEHFVRPEPGRLVLFPSYMWHGTVPFASDERRTTIAFDVVPA